MSPPKRYALVGTGGRCSMFIEAAVKTHAEHAELVGLCDLSPVRMDYWNQRIVNDFGGEAVPACVTGKKGRLRCSRATAHT